LLVLPHLSSFVIFFWTDDDGGGHEDIFLCIDRGVRIWKNAFPHSLSLTHTQKSPGLTKRDENAALTKKTSTDENNKKQQECLASSQANNHILAKV
jgi:hypothetical protein